MITKQVSVEVEVDSADVLTEATNLPPLDKLSLVVKLLRTFTDQDFERLSEFFTHPVSIESLHLLKQVRDNYE